MPEEPTPFEILRRTIIPFIDEHMPGFFDQTPHNAEPRLSKRDEILIAVIIAIFGTIPFWTPIRVALWCAAALLLAHIAYRYCKSEAQPFKGPAIAVAILIAEGLLLVQPVKTTLFPVESTTTSSVPSPVSTALQLTDAFGYIAGAPYGFLKIDGSQFSEQADAYKIAAATVQVDESGDYETSTLICKSVLYDIIGGPMHLRVPLTQEFVGKGLDNARFYVLLLPSKVKDTSSIFFVGEVPKLGGKVLYAGSPNDVK